MLLKSWTIDVDTNGCRPDLQYLHCTVSLGQDVGGALPYLNAVLGSFIYTEEPPAMTIKRRGRNITVNAKSVEINIVRDAVEADEILTWLQTEINQAWERRHEIEPQYTATPQPQALAIYKLLPGTNCSRCGLPSCMAFAGKAAKGEMGVEHCPELDEQGRQKLADYLGRFRFIL